MKVLAFGHQKEVGKDEAAKFAIQHLRFTGKFPSVRKAAFADKMKEICYEMFSWAGLKQGWYYDENRKAREIILPKVGKTPRQLWIEVGMGGRAVYPDVWVHGLFGYISGDFILISDLRFPNEAEAIKNMGGKVVKIVRPSVPHTSDPADDPLLGYTGWSDTIVNDGTLGDLNKNVITVVESMIHGY